MQKKASNSSASKSPVTPAKAAAKGAGSKVPAKKATSQGATKTKAPAKGAKAAPPKETPAKQTAPAKAKPASGKAAHPDRQAGTRTAPHERHDHPRAPGKTTTKQHRPAFLDNQKRLLLEERGSYIRSAEALKAQADSLALEHEPGDVQFDEEGGEGGTANVDREMDLHLSAQARATVAEIDRALEKISEGIYGLCELCHQPIPEPRLEALPYAALCVSCKSGGLSSRR